MKIKYLLPTVLLIFFSCDNPVNILYPVYDPSGLLSNTRPLDPSSRQVIEGVYAVTAGHSAFGDTIILKWNKDYLSAFTADNAGIIILEGGRLDSSIIFKGIWRKMLNAEHGSIELIISFSTGAGEILHGNQPDSLLISGSFGKGKNIPDNRAAFQFVRPIATGVQNREFYLLSHRGGGRNSDLLGASENTIEMIRKSEQLGANGVEIDIRLSKDNIPFLYHDPDINLRLTRDGLLGGQIEDYTFPQIRSFIELKNGERIPSLREALEFIVMETQLQLVWIDLKSGKNEIPFVVPIIREALIAAAGADRRLEILLGIPEEYKAEQFKSYPDYKNIGSICELGPDETRELNSKIWAPRWTEGLQNEKVREIKSEGKRVFVWTLDEPDFIRRYITEGEFDGILSNYIPLVSYYHYLRER